MVNIGELATIAIIFVVVAIVLSIGSDIIYNVQNGTDNVGGYSWNASSEGLEGLEELASWLPTIAIVVAAAVIIGLLSYFYLNRR